MIPDILEHFERRAEARAEELFDGEVWKCASCGERIEPGHEQPGSVNPYSMPVCPKCAALQEGKE